MAAGVEFSGRNRSANGEDWTIGLHYASGYHETNAMQGDGDNWRFAQMTGGVNEFLLYGRITSTTGGYQFWDNLKLRIPCDNVILQGPAPPDMPGEVWDPTGPLPIPVPIGAAGNVCWRCDPPMMTIAVHVWIAWLACVIRNMFACSLRVWLYDIVNSLGAVLAFITIYQNWIVVNAQGAVNWGTAIYNSWALFWANNPIQIVLDTGQAGMSWAELIWNIINLMAGIVLSMLRLLMDGMIGILNLVWFMIDGLFSALTAPAAPYNEIILQNAQNSEGFTAAGYTHEKAYLVFMWGIYMADRAFYEFNIAWVQYLLIAIMLITFIMWFTREWHKILPN